MPAFKQPNSPTERPDFRKGPTAVIGPLELPIVREAVTGAVMPAITLPTNGLRLFRLESTCFNEPLPHARQKAVGFRHISAAFF
jgi:hypothetical protein